MRQRPQQQTPTYGEKVGQRLASLLGKRTTRATSESPRNTLPESHLVALAALDAYGLVETEGDFQAALGGERGSFDEATGNDLSPLEEAFESHKAAFEEKSGSISLEQRAAYLHLAAAIHVD